MSAIAEIKNEARAAIHDRGAVACIYSDGTTDYPTAEQVEAGLELTVRFATKTKVVSPESDGLSIMEAIERVIFAQPQLDALALEPDHNGVLTLPEYGISLQLDQPLDPDGPFNVYWTVVRNA